MIIFIILFLAAFYTLKYTSFGRSVYSVGDNKEAARLNGINVPRTQLICFLRGSDRG